MRLWIPVAVVVLAALSSGCDSEKKAVLPEPPPVAPVSPVPAKPVGGAPAPSGTQDPYAPLSPTPELDRAIADGLKAGDKKTLAAAYAKRGTFRTREDSKAGQRVKYRAALSDFRKAVNLDPKNAEASGGKTEIETIYSGMGRPIPGDAECDAVSKTGTYTPKPGEGAPAVK